LRFRKQFDFRTILLVINTRNGPKRFGELKKGRLAFKFRGIDDR